jgi:hypothetical protein
VRCGDTCDKETAEKVAEYYGVSHIRLVEAKKDEIEV